MMRTKQNDRGQDKFPLLLRFAYINTKQNGRGHLGGELVCAKDTYKRKRAAGARASQVQEKDRARGHHKRSEGPQAL
jgi:hypothetical protein